MDGGFIVEQGTPEEVFDHPKSDRTKDFLGPLSHSSRRAPPQRARPHPSDRRSAQDDGLPWATVLSVQMFHVKTSSSALHSPRRAPRPNRPGGARRGSALSQFCTICCVSSAFGRPRAPPAHFSRAFYQVARNRGSSGSGRTQHIAQNCATRTPHPLPTRPPPPAGQPPPASPRSHPPRRLAPASLPVNSSKNVIRPINIFSTNDGIMRPIDICRYRTRVRGCAMDIFSDPVLLATFAVRLHGGVSLHFRAGDHRFGVTYPCHQRNTYYRSRDRRTRLTP